MISCILLAAGESHRFGSPKPLARLGVKTVIEHIQEKLLLTGLSEIVVVLGHQANSIIPLVSKNQRIRYVINLDYASGQTSSFKTGLSRINEKSKGIMLLPIDMPLIQTTTIDELIKIFLKKSCLILVPTYESRNGHPPVFSSQLKDELNSLKNDEPVSKIIHGHETETFRLPVDDEGILLSFNTPEELSAISKKLKI